MYKFFTDRLWLLWSWGGGGLIIALTWYIVQVKRINNTEGTSHV